MQTLYDIFFFGGVLFVFIMIIGIIRPHLVLFWTEDKDRSRVLKTFAPIVILMLLGAFITSNYMDDDRTFRDEKSPDAIEQERPDPNREQPRPEFGEEE